MRRSLISALIALVLCLSHGTHALVEPEASSLPAQPWLAQIYVDDGSSSLKEFCKGALINAQWVLTSGFCVYDPFEALGPERNGAGAKYVVKFAGSGLYYDIEKFVQSDDLAAGLMKLAQPVTIQPVIVSTKSDDELRDQEVLILGMESTAAVSDYYFNPDIGKRMYCRVDGAVYFRTGAICYIMPKLVKSTTLVQTRATVIDPSATSAPSTAFDRSSAFDFSGKRLYLDFRAQGSYPCNEDLGAPILQAAANGSVELVGIVSGVGMALFPLCTPGLQNRFGTASEYQDFIDTTMAQETFNTLCPEAPTLQVEYPGGRRIRVFWNAVDGATGYRLMYTPNVGYVPFISLDVGTRTEVTTEINPSLIYHGVIVAYNEVCTSGPSAELAVYL